MKNKEITVDDQAKLATKILAELEQENRHIDEILKENEKILNLWLEKSFQKKN